MLQGMAEVGRELKNRHESLQNGERTLAQKNEQFEDDRKMLEEATKSFINVLKKSEASLATPKTNGGTTGGQLGSSDILENSKIVEEQAEHLTTAIDRMESQIKELENAVGDIKEIKNQMGEIKEMRNKMDEIVDMKDTMNGMASQLANFCMMFQRREDNIFPIPHQLRQQPSSSASTSVEQMDEDPMRTSTAPTFASKSPTKIETTVRGNLPPVSPPPIPTKAPALADESTDSELQKESGTSSPGDNKSSEVSPANDQAGTLTSAIARARSTILPKPSNAPLPVNDSSSDSEDSSNYSPSKKRAKKNPTKTGKRGKSKRETKKIYSTSPSKRGNTTRPKADPFAVACNSSKMLSTKNGNTENGSKSQVRDNQPTSSTTTGGMSAPKDRKSGRKRIAPVGKETKTTASSQQVARFFEKSTLWYAKKLLLFYISLLTPEDRAQYEQYLEQLEKFLENSEGGNTGFKLPRKILQNTELSSDHLDYRHLSKFRMETTCAMVDEIEQGSSSSSSETFSPSEPWPYLVEMSKKRSSTSADIRAAAELCSRTGQNTLYKKKDLVLPTADPNLTESDKETYKAGADQHRPLDHFRLAVPTLQLLSKEHLFAPETKAFLESHSISLISGFQEFSGLDGSLFTLDSLMDAHPDTPIDIVEQVPQSSNYNKDEQGNKSWVCPSKSRGEQSLKDFHANLEDQKKLAKKIFEELSKVECDMFTKTILGIMEEERKNQLRKDTELLWRDFGSNIDLFNEEKTAYFGAQYKEIMEKFPGYLQPKSRKNLLSYTGCNNFGVNTPQLYGKAPGARTAAHTENSLFPSINLNCGPGSCIWFAVPYEYLRKFANLVDKHYKVNGFHEQQYWPEELILLRDSIPVFKFEQKAGEMVYVREGTIHWVQSQGFCTNLSWNLGPPTPTQLSTSIISAQFNVDLNNRTVVPIRNLILNLADRNMFRDNEDIWKIVKQQLAIMLFHLKIAEEKEKMDGVELEYEKRSAFKPRFCEICHGEAALISRKEMIKKPRTKSTFEEHIWCASCEPKSANKVKTTVICTVERLSEIYDRWVQKVGDADNGSSHDPDFTTGDPDNRWIFGAGKGDNLNQVSGPSGSSRVSGTNSKSKGTSSSSLTGRGSAKVRNNADPNMDLEESESVYDSGLSNPVDRQNGDSAPEGMQHEEQGHVGDTSADVSDNESHVVLERMELGDNLINGDDPMEGPGEPTN